ncbi:glutathione S-transferase [Hypoxylon argillaceum]|nr:glutathione S-transferase [Hypoxylon argillaceum]
MQHPVVVWVTPPGSNPYKVIIILEELSIPYTIKSIKFDDVKKKPLIDVNPNRRVPAIQDPSTDLTLWESGAIINYLIKKYDTAYELSHLSFKEKHLLNQWLHFQMSGFRVLHPEKVLSAIDRYTEQVKRDWLVGDKMTYADMAWVPWNEHIHHSIGTSYEAQLDGFPNVKAWHERMVNRPTWQKCNHIRTHMMDEQGSDWNGIPKGIKSFSEYEKMIKEGTESTPVKM